MKKAIFGFVLAVILAVPVESWAIYGYGYKNVYLVEKGIVGWFEKGYPIVNTYLGEISVVKYDKKLKESYAYRENK